MSEETREKLYDACEHAAGWYERMAAGERYCPSCGKLVTAERCDECDEDTEDMHDYLADNTYDVKVITDLHGDELYGCRLMIACGGPNIYIDTEKGIVEGLWGTDRAEVLLSGGCVGEIDDIIKEWMMC